MDLTLQAGLNSEDRSRSMSATVALADQTSQTYNQCASLIKADLEPEATSPATSGPPCKVQNQLLSQTRARPRDQVTHVALQPRTVTRSSSARKPPKQEPLLTPIAYQVAP